MEESQHHLEVAQEGAYNKQDPRSLFNLLPPTLQETLLKTQNCFLNDLSDESIRKNIKETPEYKLVRKIRTSFWHEYDNALDTGRKMQMTRIWQGITQNSGEFWRIMKQDHFAVYVFTKPTNKDVQERMLLEMSYDRLEEILSAPVTKKDGSLDAFGAKVIVDLWDKLNERVHGSVVKRVHVQSEQKNLNVNIDATKTDQITSKLTRAEDLNKRLMELKEQTKDIEAISYVIEEDDEPRTDP